jgi:hypothetical protein
MLTTLKFTPDQIIPVICNLCKLRTIMQTYLCRCVLCTETFPSRLVLREHQIAVHELNREYICALCGKDYSCQGGLLVHMKEFHEPTDPDEEKECPICHKVFKNILRLRAHNRKQHGGAVTCELCGKTFKNKVRYHIY